jgi:hypothetical protein
VRIFCLPNEASCLLLGPIKACVKKLDVLPFMVANCVLFSLDISSCFSTCICLFGFVFQTTCICLFGFVFQTTCIASLDLYSKLMVECFVTKDPDRSCEMEVACKDICSAFVST